MHIPPPCCASTASYSQSQRQPRPRRGACCPPLVFFRSHRSPSSSSPLLSWSPSFITLAHGYDAHGGATCESCGLTLPRRSPSSFPLLPSTRWSTLQSQNRSRNAAGDKWGGGVVGGVVQEPCLLLWSVMVECSGCRGLWGWSILLPHRAHEETLHVSLNVYADRTRYGPSLPALLVVVVVVVMIVVVGGGR